MVFYQVFLLSPEVVCTVRLAIGFLLVLSKWCAQSRLAIGFLALLWFFKTLSFLSVVEGGYITTGPLLALVFFYLY